MALTAALAWGDENLDAKKTCCIIISENIPSIRLAEKFGFREFARTEYHDAPTILFERPRNK